MMASKILLKLVESVVDMGPLHQLELFKKMYDGKIFFFQ